MKISFSPAMAWSEDRTSLLVRANADGKTFRCVVPQEFLTAPLVESLNEAQACMIFEQRKVEIEACLETRIHNGACDPAGEIILLP